MCLLAAIMTLVVAQAPAERAPPLTARSAGVVEDLRGGRSAADAGAAGTPLWIVACDQGLVAIGESGVPTDITGAPAAFGAPVSVQRRAAWSIYAVDSDGDVFQVDGLPDQPSWSPVFIPADHDRVVAGALLEGGQGVTQLALARHDRVEVMRPDGTVLWQTAPRREVGRPGGLAYMHDGTLAVTDADRCCVIHFGDDGTVVRRAGSRGSFPGQFKDPRGIVESQGVLLVADRLNHRIVRLAPDLSFLDFWGMHAVWPRAADGATHYPTAVAVSADGGAALVVEPFERRVQRFAAVTEEERARLAGLIMPSVEGVQSHFGPSIDSANGRLVVFDPEAGAVILFLHTLPQPIHVSTIGMPGTTMLPDAAASAQAVTGESVEGPGRIGRIEAIALSRDGSQLLLADAAHQTMQLWALGPTPEPLRFDPFLPELRRIVPLATLAPPGTEGVADLASTPDGWAVLWREPAGSDEARVTLLGASLERLAEHRYATVGAPATRLAVHGDALALLLPQAGSVIVDGGRGIEAIRLEGAQAPTDIVFLDGPARSGAPDGTGGFIVTDAGLDGFLLVDREGRRRAFLGGTGLSDGRFWAPEAVTVDPDGTVIVVDGGNHRLQRFVPPAPERGSEGSDAPLEWTMTFSLGRAYTRPRNLDAPQGGSE